MGQVFDAVVLIGCILLLTWIIAGILLTKAMTTICQLSREIVHPVWMDSKMKINGVDHYIMAGRWMTPEGIAMEMAARRLQR